MRSQGRARGPFGLRALFISLAVSLAILGALCATQTAAAQGVRLVATTSDLASLARAVTGDLAQVEAIIPPAADPEAFQPRPSDLAKLKGASVVARTITGSTSCCKSTGMRPSIAAARATSTPRSAFR